MGALRLMKVVLARRPADLTGQTRRSTRRCILTGQKGEVGAGLDPALGEFGEGKEERGKRRVEFSRPFGRRR